MSAMIVLGLSVTLGCAGGGDSTPTGRVSGTISAQGSPLSQVRVIFTSKTGGAGATADVQSDGGFEVEGELPVGDYVVSVSSMGLGDTPPSEDARQDAPKPLENVPEKYQSETTSDLTATVEEGSNEFSFDLQP